MSDTAKLAFLESARKPFKPSPQKAVAYVEPQPSLNELEVELIRLLIRYLEKAE